MQVMSSAAERPFIEGRERLLKLSPKSIEAAARANGAHALVTCWSIRRPLQLRR
ncbi:hypothetical protein IDH44_19835 [Paenibacillus sp. IB182496]|uniref:Uncharacterized protein n=1 Tax=Paenibacillus sabuli TaxID=2772509 RepID=A0A927GTD4_9BACL|nr:hypothetical protein [Paenibacillus sabuli]MBD2847458.1 hypothetical protein [Paenibacillus sabuli]